jgi:ribosome-associated translation inhibitor RaiA
MTPASEPTLNVDVTTRGEVAPEHARRAAERVAELERITTGPILQARVVLTQERNPRIELPARAEGHIVFAGQPIRARVAAPAMRAAVDQLADRLRERLRRHVERLTTQHRVPAPEPEPSLTPPRSWRPVGERRIVRRKTFALEPTTAINAAADMVALDHQFYLFHDLDTGTESVVYRRDDGRIAVIQPAGAPVPDDEYDIPREPSRYSEPIAESDAVAEMDMLNHRFLYFTNAATGRGCVIYLRYDGDYGLIEPAS